ncbi:urease accessory protein UreE, partial [Azospirillum brasilense]|uniref:urease accessory protein UreE n=1 Tax=Azospirillum brasilense TaxID=192 RepID=UPI000FF25907
MTDTLRRATRVHARGHWPAEREAGTVTLAFDDRHRRRMVMTDDAGADFLLDLPRAVGLDPLSCAHLTPPTNRGA